jgi:flagellar motor switch protein FliG
LIKNFPDYKEFCKWADTLNGEISASVPKENIFGFLEIFSPDQLVPLLKNEAPVIAAAVLSRLPSNVSAETLGKFPPNLKTEILKHIARKSEVFPDVLERVAAVLREKSGLEPHNCHTTVIIE